MAPIVGHVGDGNFHLTLLIDMDDNDEVTRAQTGFDDGAVSKARSANAAVAKNRLSHSLSGEPPGGRANPSGGLQFHDSLLS